MGWNLLLHWNFGFQVSDRISLKNEIENSTFPHFKSVVPDDFLYFRKMPESFKNSFNRNIFLSAKIF